MSTINDDSNNIELRNATCPQEGSQREDTTGPTTDQQNSHETTGQSLLPYDRGMAAWRMLISAFVFEALLWGMHAHNFTHVEYVAYEN
jgi:hypothetical protein